MKKKEGGMKEGERDRERKQERGVHKRRGNKKTGYLGGNSCPRDQIRRKLTIHCIPFCTFCIS